MTAAKRWLAIGLVVASLAVTSKGQAEEPRLVPVPSMPPPANFQALPLPRSAEIAVELAWLSDASTFAYPLQARWMNGTVELLGRIPSPALRDKAVAIAKGAVPIPVIDRMTVTPAMMLALPQPPDASFVDEAKSRFFSLGPVDGKQMELKATRDGKLFITGWASSEEEKLAYSKVFRGLVGCKLVRNEMEVRPAEAAGLLPLPPMPEAKPRAQLGRPQPASPPRNKDGVREEPAMPAIDDELGRAPAR